MTINEENEIEVRIGHPRLVGGRFIALNLTNYSESIENDINYIPYPRNPNDSDYAQGPETRATDMLKISDTWEPTGIIATDAEDGTNALPSDMFVEETDKQYNSAEVGGDDRETIDISVAGFDRSVHLGATKIKDGSVTVINETTSTTLTQGDDYGIDNYRGMIQFSSSAGNKGDEYSVGYLFKNTPRNIAQTLRKLPKLGGPSVWIYGLDQEYTGSTKGFRFTVFPETVDVELGPQNPNRAQVSISMRKAVLINV